MREVWKALHIARAVPCCLVSGYKGLPYAQVSALANAALALLHTAIQGRIITASAPAASGLCGVRSHPVTGQVALSGTQATCRPHSATRAVSRTAVLTLRSSRRAQLRSSASCEQRVLARKRARSGSASDRTAGPSCGHGLLQVPLYSSTHERQHAEP